MRMVDLSVNKMDHRILTRTKGFTQIFSDQGLDVACILQLESLSELPLSSHVTKDVKYLES